MATATDLLPELGIHDDACLQFLRFRFLPPNGGAGRPAPVVEIPLASAVGKTLPDVRDTAQKDRRVPMPLHPKVVLQVLPEDRVARKDVTVNNLPAG